MINLIYIDGSGRKKARPVRNREEYFAQRNAPENVKNFQAAREGDSKAKARQVQYNYNDLLPNGVLRGCHHVASTFAHDIDCQSPEEQERIKQVLLEKKDEIGLLELSGSANYGLHAVCRRERGKTILENQVRLSMLTQTEMDTSTHDEQRIMFTGPATPDNLFYLDDAIFDEQLSVEESAEEFKRLKEREAQGLEKVPAGAKKANKHYRPWEEARTHPQPLPKGVESNQPTACKVEGEKPASCKEKADERTRFIAQGVMREKGLVESDFLDEGGRHTSVKMFLSGATQLLTKEEANGILAELMPDHWSDQNIQQLVSDFYQNYTNPSQRLLKYQENLFTQSRRLYGKQSEDGSQRADNSEQSVPPELPKRLPKLIELLTSRTPDVYKAALAHALFPPLATHLCGVSFRYTDNVEHEATLMNCLMAATGAGKGCIDEPIRHIMADIKRRDDENMRREAEWKKDCQKKGANKDKLLRPEGLVIQIIDPDMTKPALVTRMDEAEGHFVYVKLNELDLFEQLKGQTGKQHFQLMCLAFDPGAEYGQTRVGTQSVTARPVCRFNWNACTTILKGRRFFSRVLTDGPISRINFCTIPEMEIGAEQPVYGQYDLEFDEAIRPYIDNLTKARGLIDCKQAFSLAKKLQRECAEFARLSQNEVYWNLSHRACVIAWLKACVLYVANGCKWERAIEDFARWSLEYDMWCKMEFFGEDIAKANTETERRGGTRVVNLLELLPDEFTLDDARRVRQQQGMSNERGKCQNMIRQWVFRNYVTKATNSSYKKNKDK
ncbi:MAG: hypothetical protein K5842_05625 [Bacteroidales bacterium]|nr:hypothetical protein [Bacteroidales bacterium]